MKDLGKVYLKAAEGIEWDMNEYSCDAVFENSAFHRGEIDGFPAKLYAKVFSPDGEVGGPYSAFSNAIEAEQDRKNLRLTMLCMMAACWKDMLPLMEGK